MSPGRCTTSCPRRIRLHGNPGQRTATNAQQCNNTTASAGGCSCATRRACAHGGRVPCLLQELGYGTVQQDAERVRVAQQLPHVPVGHGPAAPCLRHRLQCTAAMALRSGALLACSGVQLGRRQRASRASKGSAGVGRHAEQPQQHCAPTIACPRLQQRWQSVEPALRTSTAQTCGSQLCVIHLRC